MSLRASAVLHAKVTVARWICHPVIGRALSRLFADEIPSRGVIAFTRSPAVSDRTRAQLFWGLFEASERRLIQRHLRGDLDVVELGAGAGVISAHIAKRLRGARRLVAIEAHPALVPLIEQNVAMNAPGARLTVVHGAIGYGEADEVEIVPGRDSHASTRIGESDAGDLGIRVPRLGLGDALERAGVDGRYALVADIEGAEHALVDHDASALVRCDQIIAELHDAPERARSADELLGRIEALGFTLVERHGNVCVLERPRTS